MPVYELVVAVQQLERPMLKQALKRAANYIFEEKGVIRNIENLGLRDLPYFIKANGKKHKCANYFIFNYSAGTKEPKEVLDKLRLDLDVVRARNFVLAESPLDLHMEKKKPECNLHLDLQPPPFRSTVIALQEIGKRKKRVIKGKNMDDPEFELF